eukprot:Ihof_evm2s619 gene=Ihof_evmTU2s619
MFSSWGLTSPLHGTEMEEIKTKPIDQNIGNELIDDKKSNESQTVEPKTSTSSWFSSATTKLSKLVGDVQAKASTVVSSREGQDGKDNDRPQGQNAATMGLSLVSGITGLASSWANKIEEELTKLEAEQHLAEESQKREANTTASWGGMEDGGQAMTQILALSTDKRNFIMAPPPGTEFVFNLDDFIGVAIATMELDADLKQMRFKLVPQLVSEETFWRNYFYRVSLIRQQFESADINKGQLNATVLSTSSTTAPSTDSQEHSTPQLRAMMVSGKPIHDSELPCDTITVSPIVVPAQPLNQPIENQTSKERDDELDDLEEELKDLEVDEG